MTEADSIRFEEIHAAAIRRGDPEIWGELYTRYSPIIRNFLLGRTSNPEIAQDIWHDTYLKAFVGCGNWGRNGYNMRALLFKIANDKLIDHYRKQRIRRRYSESLDACLDFPNPEDLSQVVVDADEYERVCAAIGELTNEQQIVIQARFLEPTRISDIAANLGKTEGSVKAMQHRALRSLHRKLVSQEE